MNKIVKSIVFCSVVTAISLMTGCKTGVNESKNMYDSFKYISAEDSGFEYDVMVGKYEVSRAWFKHLLGDEVAFSEYPMTAIEGDARPADNITKVAAAKFCNLLSVKNGKVPFYVISGDTVSESSEEEHEFGFRLLTKTEWETCAKAGTENTYSGVSASLPTTGNNASYKVFDGDPISTEKNKNNVDVPVYDDTVPTRDVTSADTSANPFVSGIANIADPALDEYAWTKFNVTGEILIVPQPKSAVEGSGNWSLFKYNGVYFKSNAYGYAAARGSVDDDLYGTHAVGTRKPNEWELYDMTGNVSELVEEGSFVGGDIASNTSKIYIGHASYENKVNGFRVCCTVKSGDSEK